jgi:hypothetical protein
MKILIAPDAPATLADPDDFRSFAVEATRGAALGAAGRPEGDAHVFVDPAALRALPGARAEDPEWSRALDGMLAYAASKGWTDAAGHVRAHVEWVG